MATCHPNLIGFNITNIFSINTSYKRQVPGLNKNTNSRVHLVPCTYVAVYVHQIRWTIYKELFIKKKTIYHERAETSVLHLKMNLIL